MNVRVEAFRLVTRDWIERIEPMFYATLLYIAGGVLLSMLLVSGVYSQTI